MIKKLFLFLFLAFLNFSYGQRKIDPLPEHIELAKELQSQFEDDNIVLLKSKDYITFDFNKKTKKVTVNRKINEELINISSRADIHKYLFYDGQSSISEFKFKYRNNKEAYFYPVDEAYTSDDLFHNDARVKHVAVDFPVQGYKYLFEAQKQTKDIKYFTSLYFSDEYPILKKEIKLVIPKWLNIELKEMNFEGYDIEKTEKTDDKSGARIISFVATKLAAQFDEKRAPGPSYIYPHILVLAKSYIHDKETHNLFNETKDLYGWYKSLVDSMNEDSSLLKDKVTELTANAKSDEEKIKNIYYWVQDNIRYIAFEDGIAGFKPDESQNVFKKRYGDCKGMANLTKQMLKEAGFDARLTWIGTKRIAYDYSTPNLSVDNHMICTLLKDGKNIFLDGTEKFNSFGEYAERIQGKQVLIEDGENFILKTVPVLPAKMNETTFVYNAKIVDDAIKGSVSRTFLGESRSSFLYHYDGLKNDKKEDALKYYLNNDDKNLLVSNIHTSDLTNRDDKLTMNYDLEQKNAVSSFDDEIYIDLDYRKEFGNFEFKNRKTDYLFYHKRNLKSEVNLEIPDGYKVSELPKSINVDTKNYALQLSYQLEGNILKYKKHFVIKNAILETSDYDDWNKTIKDLQAIYKEQIILSKKQ